jgi:hypothetical protein
MIIDNSIRRRWGLIPNQSGSAEDNNLLSDFELENKSSTSQEFSNRFQSSAQEWLLTWRILE